MLTRLKVSGFKNLVDADVSFGPFTCIAGPNGVGKSNLFDAIRFLSALADKTFEDAALSVRDVDGLTGGVGAIFHRVGREAAKRVRFEAQMIIPSTGVDDLNQPVRTTSTFLRYTLELGSRPGPYGYGKVLEVLHEELTPIPREEVDQHLRFPRGAEWQRSAVRVSGRKSPYISTEQAEEGRVIRLHGDGAAGKATALPAGTLSRTILSATTKASEDPTVVIARREMQSWRLLDLQPSALRRPDAVDVGGGKLGSDQLAPDGAHLPTALFRMARTATAREGPSAHLYEQVAGRLRELLPDVREVGTHLDDKRELLTVWVKDRNGTTFPAADLSDGTLRFLALAALEFDPEATGVFCIEEPENGIHPARIPDIVRLLYDIATGTDFPVGDDNPLRQVIVNTHSPGVVGEVSEADLLGATLREAIVDGKRFRKTVFRCLPGTWRAGVNPKPVELPKGDLLAYLNPVPAGRGEERDGNGSIPGRLRDRPDLGRFLDGPAPG